MCVRRHSSLHFVIWKSTEAEVLLVPAFHLDLVIFIWLARRMQISLFLYLFIKTSIKAL